jgi:hypothetical protein
MLYANTFEVKGDIEHPALSSQIAGMIVNDSPARAV